MNRNPSKKLQQSLSQNEILKMLKNQKERFCFTYDITTDHVFKSKNLTLGYSL